MANATEKPELESLRKAQSVTTNIPYSPTDAQSQEGQSTAILSRWLWSAGHALSILGENACATSCMLDVLSYACAARRGSLAPDTRPNCSGVSRRPDADSGLNHGPVTHQTATDATLSLPVSPFFYKTPILRFSRGRLKSTRTFLNQVLSPNHPRPATQLWPGIFRYFPTPSPSACGAIQPSTST
ncbi:hypothetical protein RRG08_010163 [Elysia crispata]|uniref:Uncharacterized protein n=1 Tax=Elysia crispata TaxID=231223 RepID=A0AAE1AJ68_9GAST|nr:hypothetical protein RRG08_010163 [Elysia crispata]